MNKKLNVVDLDDCLIKTKCKIIFYNKTKKKKYEVLTADENKIKDLIKKSKGNFDIDFSQFDIPLGSLVYVDINYRLLTNLTRELSDILILTARPNKKGIWEYFKRRIPKLIDVVSVRDLIKVEDLILPEQIAINKAREFKNWLSKNKEYKDITVYDNSQKNLDYISTSVPSVKTKREIF